MSALSVLAAIAAPSARDVSVALALETESQRIAMALAQGRVSAINRGHIVAASFDDGGFLVVDTQAGNEVVAAGTLSSMVTVEATGSALFSPLGTLYTPIVVTLHRGDATRVVRAGLTGTVEIE